MFGQQGMGQGPCTLTLWQVRAVCTQREPTGRVIVVIVTEREEKEKRKRTNEENDGREKEEGREKERRDEREKRTPPPSSPCVGSKRLRVSVQNASVCTGKTRACVQHARVLPVHTEAF